MPELPDIVAYISALEERVVGRTLLRVRVKSPFLLRTAEPPLACVEGRVIRELRRLGKRIAFGFEDELWLVLHMMIAGRLHWRAPEATLAPRNALAAFDFSEGTLLLTEAGTTSRASLGLYRGDAALRAVDPGGIDPLTAEFADFRAALRVENRTLKRALTDPRTISAIGNAYSDEILHAARLSPLALTHKLRDAEWLRLHGATQTTLRTWVERLRAESGADFPERVTAFRADMAVHGRFGKPCPVCGQIVQRIRYANNETNYCARCQTGGRVLSDRSLSRLLKGDWPRTLDDPEEPRR